MSAQPWMKFYPRDWRGDQAVRSVSGFARGLWIECICIMHEAEPYGHLVLNGRPIGPDVLARMVSLPADEVRAGLAELSDAGVFSVNRAGIVFSRRMKMDRNRAEKGRKAVSKRYVQDAENIDENGRPSRSPPRYPSRLPTTQKPDTRVQKVEKEGRKEESSTPSPSCTHSGSVENAAPVGAGVFGVPSRAEIAEAERVLAAVRPAVKKAAPRPILSNGMAVAFDEFWSIYPARQSGTRLLKPAKVEAQRAFARACENTTPAEIIAAVRNYPFDLSRRRFIQAPAVWLNKGEFHAEISTERPPTPAPEGKMTWMLREMQEQADDHEFGITIDAEN